MISETHGSEGEFYNSLAPQGAKNTSYPTLETIDAKLECSEETISARVLSGGEDEQFLQLLDPTELEAGEVIELSIKPDSRKE